MTWRFRLLTAASTLTALAALVLAAGADHFS
jgi:hypothetical protein